VQGITTDSFECGGFVSNSETTPSVLVSYDLFLQYAPFLFTSFLKRQRSPRVAVGITNSDEYS
jgi:hypothetical protein